MADFRTPASRDDDLDVAATEFAHSTAGVTVAEQSALRDEFTRYCLPFADRLAHRYTGRGEPTDDLEQVSRMALVKAIDRYEVDRGSFTAYAVLTMTGELKKHFRDKTWGVHVARRVQDLSLAVTRISRDLTGELNRRPTTAEIATRLGVGEADVREAITSAAGHTSSSLNAPIKDGEADEVGDLIGTLDAQLELVDDKVTLAGLLQRLPAREQRMLALRFYGNRTQNEIAEEFGVSQMHVSRLLARALSWLRDAMLSDVPPPWPGTDAPRWQLLVRLIDGLVTVRVRGEVDRDTAGQLRTCLQENIAPARRQGALVLDLADVPLMDARGVAALVDGVQAAGLAGVELRLSGVRPQVRAVLDACGLSHLHTHDPSARKPPAS